MSVHYKLINSVELDRKGRIQYRKTLPISNPPLPGSCPTLAQLIPVFNSWSEDFSLLPDSDNLGAGWTPYHSTCTNRANSPTTFVRGGFVQTGSDPVQNIACGDPTDTSGDPSFNFYTAIPSTVKDQIVSAVYDHSAFVADPLAIFTDFGEFSLLARANQFGVGSLYQSNVTTYLGSYREQYNHAGVFQHAQASIVYWDHNGRAILAGPTNIPRMNQGEVLMFTVANFLFNPNFEAVCLKLYTAGVQRLAVSDFAGTRILTGGMGIGAEATTGGPNNGYLYFNNWLAQQVGPNPI